MKLTLLFTAFITSTTLYAGSFLSKTYKGCALTKKEALYTLSGNIQSQVSTSIEARVEVNENDTVQSKISSYSKASTNLSLVNIEYKKQDKEVCAIVYKDDQEKNTKKLLKQALLYDENNLPKNIDSKIEKLSLWIANIKQLSFLLPAFVESSDKEQEILNTKEKIFTDLYTHSVSHSESLFFRSCKETKAEAKVALNKQLFSNTKVQEDKGFFDSLTSLLTSDDSTEMLDIFEEQLISIQKDSQSCLMLKKDELLYISKNMNADMNRISKKSLSQEPKIRYKEISNLYEQIKVTKALLKLYPNEYKSNHFKQLSEAKKRLDAIKETTYPQFIVFNLSGGEKISIILDNKPIKNNEKLYLKNGEHSYKIMAKGKCPIIDNFSNDLLEDTTISKDLESQNYPTVVFLTDKEPNITVNGKVIKANITTTIEKCKDESRYVAKYARQTVSGDVNTQPGQTSTIELDFLTAEELGIFNAAKTKSFSTTSQATFSESLTSVNSDSLEFSISRSPKNGSLTLHESGSFEYTSNKGFVGVDNFQYKITTPQKTSAPKLVTITVGKSLIPLAVVKTVSTQDTNTSKVVTIQEEIKEKVDAAKKQASVSYEDFKMYVQSKELSEEFLQKVQKKFPEYFEKLRKEMTQQ